MQAPGVGEAGEVYEKDRGKIFALGLWIMLLPILEATPDTLDATSSTLELKIGL